MTVFWFTRSKPASWRHRFFGKQAAINAPRNQVAVENFPGEVSIYNLADGDREADFIINGGVAFIRFNPEGSKLFILSGAQTAYAFDLNKINRPPSATSKSE